MRDRSRRSAAICFCTAAIWETIAGGAAEDEEAFATGSRVTECSVRCCSFLGSLSTCTRLVVDDKDDEDFVDLL